MAVRTKLQEWGLSGWVYDLINDDRAWKELRSPYRRDRWWGLLIGLLNTEALRPMLKKRRLLREIAYFAHERYTVQECPQDRKHPDWYLWPRHRYVGPSIGRMALACSVHAKRAQMVRWRKKKEK